MSGLLGSVYSYGNTLQRKLKGLLADPAGTIGLGVTRMGEDQQQLVNLAQDAGYMPGSRSVLVSPEQKALARALLAQKGTEMGGAMVGAVKGRPVDVYHGTTSPVSPETFDVFRGGSASRHASAEVPVMWTSRSPKVAQMFINESVNDLTPLKQYGPRGAGTQAIGLSNAWKEGANIVPMKATLKNPYVIKGSDAEMAIFGAGDWRYGGEQFAKVVQAAKEAGHDGVIIKANPRGSLEFRADQYLLFDPASQAKSRFSGADSSNALANALRSKD